MGWAVWEKEWEAWEESMDWDELMGWEE